MSSHKNFSQKSRKDLDGNYNDFDFAESFDPANLESIDVEEWAEFLSYYRHYIDEFAENVLGIKLFPFQRLVLRCMARYEESLFIACRGLTKSFLSAVYFVCVAILYPGIKLGIASGKGQQARNVIVQKIKGELWKNNENVRREILGNIKTGSDDCVVNFKNGSEIRAIVLGHDGENARSWRFNQILVDEARLVKDDVINEILVPMTKTKRPAVIDLVRRFGSVVPREKGKIIYISSAYLKTCDLYKRFKLHYEKMMSPKQEDKNKYFVACLPYHVGVKAGIFEEEDILKEKDKPSMTTDKFLYEYEGVFVGSSGESYFPYEVTEECRSLNRCEISQPKKSNAIYVISHDVALSNAKDSDNACTTVIKLKEKPNGTYSKEVVFIKTHNGKTLPQQRDYLREILLKFPNTIKLVLDTMGNGEALPSLFDEPWEFINEKGETVECPPLIPDDDDSRKNLKGAIPLIRAIKASNTFNNTMYTYMKSSFENKSIKLLKSATEVDTEYKLGEISEEEYHTFVNTDLLIQELSNIKQEVSGHNNIIYERIAKATKRDRATSLGYGLSFINELETTNKHNLNDSDDDYMFFMQSGF